MAREPGPRRWRHSSGQTASPATATETSARSGAARRAAVRLKRRSRVSSAAIQGGAVPLRSSRRVSDPTVLFATDAVPAQAALVAAPFAG